MFKPPRLAACVPRNPTVGGSCVIIHKLSTTMRNLQFTKCSSSGKKHAPGDTVRDVEACSREYDVDEPGPRLPGRVRDELMAAFAVDEDRGVTRVRRTWLDTFDWRLARAGLTLQHAGPRGHGELVLTGTAGQQLTARFAHPARPPRWPCLADALPPGPLRDQVTAVAGLRALLPVVTAVSQVHEVRLLNADDKTVSRIAVDAMALAGPCSAPLPTRLAVTGVRGYPGAARRAHRILRGTAGGHAQRADGAGGRTAREPGGMRRTTPARWTWPCARTCRAPRRSRPSCCSNWTRWRPMSTGCCTIRTPNSCTTCASPCVARGPR